MAEKTATPEMVQAARPPYGYKSIVSSSAFGWATGPVFERIDARGWRRGFRVSAKHTNEAGVCHGGMMMTFADLVLSRAMMEAGHRAFVTVRLTTDFIAPAFLDSWVWGTATPRDVGDGVIALTAEFFGEDKLVATSSGLFKTVRARKK